MAHYGLGEYAEAVPYLRAAAQADARNLQLRLTLAHSCLWTKQYQCVLDAYHEILLLNAESAEADMLAGEALDATKDSPGAIQQFRAAVKADPRQPDVHFGLGYLLWIQKQYEEAAGEFQAELANNPNHVQAMIYLGDTQMELSRPEAALPLIENSLRLDTGQELAHLDLGILYSDAGRRDDALRELKIAEKLDPSDEKVHWRLGRLYQAEGRKDEAKAEFDTTRAMQKAVDGRNAGRAACQPITGANAIVSLHLWSLLQNCLQVTDCVRARLQSCRKWPIQIPALDSSPDSSLSGPIRHRVRSDSQRVRIEARDESKTQEEAKATAKTKTPLSKKQMQKQRQKP
jgi:tetratricopeptide (TPR) repeat protein